ncbi:MAG: ferrous iron transport protein A [Phycisphaerae bacterium]|nr:ferrous iron transport protein A [Phycisphaerae bacterium]
MTAPETNKAPAMPLMQVAEAQTVRLVEIRGGRGLQHRLAEMGLLPGATFTVINNHNPGPCTISLKGSRLILGRGMVHRVFVTPKN